MIQYVMLMKKIKLFINRIDCLFNTLQPAPCFSCLLYQLLIAVRYGSVRRSLLCLSAPGTTAFCWRSNVRLTHYRIRKDKFSRIIEFTKLTLRLYETRFPLFEIDYLVEGIRIRIRMWMRMQTQQRQTRTHGSLAAPIWLYFSKHWPSYVSCRYIIR